MSTQLRIPTRPGMGRGLINHDDRSRGFRAVDLIPPDAKPRTKHWRRPGAYDQGKTPECVAFTGKGLLNTVPLSRLAPYRVRSRYDTQDFYDGAQANDETPGTSYDGTSALGLCRYLLLKKIISAYHWTFSLDEALLTLSWVGPLGIGIKWTEDMFRPNSQGVIRPTGAFAGGHEIEVSAIDVAAQEVELTNSWGPGWGDRGRARLSFTDLGSLLADQGDSVVITS